MNERKRGKEMMGKLCRAALACAFLTMSLVGCTQVRGTGDLGIVVERATGSVLVVETTHHRPTLSDPGARRSVPRFRRLLPRPTLCLRLRP